MVFKDSPSVTSFLEGEGVGKLLSLRRTHKVSFLARSQAAARKRG